MDVFGPILEAIWHNYGVVPIQVISGSPWEVDIRNYNN